MRFDVYLDTGVSIEADRDPDNSPDGTPYEGDDHQADFDAFKEKARLALIAMLESGSFDISYDRSKA